jgi:hypothetical protein
MKIMYIHFPLEMFWQHWESFLDVVFRLVVCGMNLIMFCKFLSNLITVINKVHNHTENSNNWKFLNFLWSLVIEKWALVLIMFWCTFQKPPPGAIKVMPTSPPDKKDEKKLAEQRRPAENG